MENLTAIILCLGEATRMRPLSLGTPKSLIHFCLKPLLEFTLEQLSYHSITNVILVTGFEDAEWQQFVLWGRQRGMKLTVLKRGLEFGSAGVIKSVVNELETKAIAPVERLLVIYGDSLFNVDFTGMFTAHREYSVHGGLLTVGYHQPPDLIPAGKTHTNYGIPSLAENFRVVQFQEKPPVVEIRSPYASAAVFLLDRAALNFIPSENPSDLSSHVIARLAHGNSSPVFGFDISPGYRYDIGTIRDFVQRQFDVLNGRIGLSNVAESFTAERPPAFSQCSLQGTSLIGKDCLIADGVSPRLGNRDRAATGEIIAGQRGLAALQALRRARVHDAPALDAGAGPEVDHVIGVPDRLLVVLDHHDGVADVAHAFERRQQPAIVALV